MFLVAVTGGIASGKSTVSRLFADLGCPVVDADQIARQVVEPGKRAWHRIRQSFGDKFFHDDGTLNRELIGELIFTDAGKRTLLNSITHPEICKVMLRQLAAHCLRGEQFVILDLPLLFESGKMLPYINTIIVVYCTHEMQVERLCMRTGCSPTSAEQRINAQMSLEEKCRRADIVIVNTGSMSELRPTVESIHGQLRASRAHWKLRLFIGGSLTAFIVSIVIVSRNVWSYFNS